MSGRPTACFSRQAQPDRGRESPSCRWRQSPGFGPTESRIMANVHPLRTASETEKSLAEAFETSRTLVDICRSLQIYPLAVHGYAPGIGLFKIKAPDQELANWRAEGLNNLANLLFFTFWQVSTVLKTGDLHDRLAVRYTCPVRFTESGSHVLCGTCKRCCPGAREGLGGVLAGRKRGPAVSGVEPAISLRRLGNWQRFGNGSTP